MFISHILKYQIKNLYHFLCIIIQIYFYIVKFNILNLWILDIFINLKIVFLSKDYFYFSKQ